MDLRDYGCVPMPDSKEEELKWREEQEKKLHEDEHCNR